MRTFRIVLQSAAAGLLAVSLLPSPARSAEGDQLQVFGYLTRAAATPVAFQYNQPSFGVPSTPTFEIRYMHSESNLDSGPAGRALSSVVWPGDLAGNAPPALIFESFVPDDLFPQTDQENAGWTAFRNQLIAGAEGSPSYPIRAESFYPQEPHANRNDLGAGISMDSSANERVAQAVTTGNNSSFPSLFEARNLNSSTFSGIRDGVAVAEARASAKQLSFFGGVITVEGFRTNKIVTSDGVTAKVEGSLQLSGLTINGTRVLSVDEGGPKIGDQAIDTAQATAALQQLAEQGFTIKLAEEAKSVAGPEGRTRVFGLSISMDSRGMNKLPEPLRSTLRSPGSSAAGPAYDQLPGTAQGFADSFGQGDQTLTILLGDVSVASVASPPFVITQPVFPDPVTPAFVPPALTLPPATPGTVTPPAPATGNPVFVPKTVPVAASHGVPMPLAMLSFVVAAGATAALRAFADKATCAAAAGGPRCSLTP